MATTNGSNKVTATTDDETAQIVIKLGDTEIENGSSPSWEVGENTLTITVSDTNAEGATVSKTYTVTVTKS